jgi:putative ABC transport system ATP-binding protein
MISVNGIAKSFGSRPLWSDLSFAVGRGQMLALVGPSGSGKSTLLHCLGLLEAVDEGEIVVEDKDITKFGAGAQRRFRRDTLGYLFQNYALIDNATVDFNLRVALGAHGGRGNKRDAFDAALGQVGLSGRGKEKVYRLSGGEQQRVALARLLVKEPRLVLADEPTGALDRDNAAMVINILRQMAAQGCAIIVATHNAEVEAGCDKVLQVG